MRRRFLWITVTLLGWPSLLLAQVTGPPYTFVAGTIAQPSEVNTNFSTIYAAALNRTGGTMTGTLNTLNVLPTVTNASDLGSTSFFYRTANLRTSVVLGQTTANYTLTWANPASARAISFEDPGGTDILVYKAATQTLTGKTLTAPVLGGTVTGTYTLGGTPTITSPTISAPTFSGVYTLGGTPTIPASGLTGTITSSVQDNITRTGTLVSGATGAGFTVALTTSTITGTLADARLSANVPLLNTVNAFTAFGNFTWTAGGAGFQTHTIKNSTAGVGNGARVAVTNDAADVLNLDMYGSTFTTATYQFQSGASVVTGGSGGMSLGDIGSGVLRLYAGGTSIRFGVGASGDWFVGTGLHIMDSVGVPTALTGAGGNGGEPDYGQAGTDYAFFIGLGGAGGALDPSNTITYSFGHTFASKPACTASSDGDVVRVQTSTTGVTLINNSGSNFTNSSHIYVLCRGY